jgi:hypothetical protein
MAFVKNRSTVSNLHEYSSFVLKSNEDGGQMDSIYTDFSKEFDKVHHKMSSDIEAARYQWLRSYSSCYEWKKDYPCRILVFFIQKKTKLKIESTFFHDFFLSTTENKLYFIELNGKKTL